MNSKDIKEKAQAILSNSQHNSLFYSTAIFLVAYMLSYIIWTAFIPYNSNMPLLLRFLLITLPQIPPAIFRIILTAYCFQIIRNDALTSNISFFKSLKRAWVPATVMAILHIALINTSVLLNLNNILTSFILIVAEIIWQISFGLSSAIVADSASLNIFDILKKAYSIMKGFRLDYLAFITSFFMPAMLSMITFGFGAIYVIPFIAISQSLYLDALKTEHGKASLFSAATVSRRRLP
ncbi:MAG: DUF975 family protein [Eubacteriaceae bacterium]|nr:DUF975 family protein [Eubacteriaceae bacterium]